MASGNTGPHSRWRKPGPRSHWQTSRVMCCTRLVRPRVTTTTHFGDHGQSHGMPCSMLCRLVVHLSCSKPNHQLHTPCAGALHCVSAHVQPCCLCLNGRKPSAHSFFAACTLWYATVGSVFASITPKSALSDMSVTEPGMRGCFPKTH